MESGELPWRQPWHLNGLLPENLYTGQGYNGFNVFFLINAKHLGNYKYPRWLTRRQGDELGWIVKPDALGYLIYRPVSDKPGKASIDPFTGKPKTDRWGNVLKWGFTTRFTSAEVFNVSEFRETSNPVKTIAELLPKDCEDKKTTTDELKRLGQARKVLEAWNRRQCRATFRSTRAVYFVEEDLIEMPPIHNFETHDEFYGTWAHEIIHSTGHEYRLGRFLRDRREVDSYAYEELVAELGSFLLAQKLKLSTDLKGHASYLQQWARILRADPSILLKVMKESQEAVSLIMKNSWNGFGGGGHRGYGNGGGDFRRSAQSPELFADGH